MEHPHLELSIPHTHFHANLKIPLCPTIKTHHLSKWFPGNAFLRTFTILLIFLILFLLEASGSELPSHDSFLSQNKVFIHNRTSPAAIALAQNHKSSTPSLPEKQKKVRGHMPKPQNQLNSPSPTNFNVNNYVKTAINFLNFGLGATELIKGGLPTKSMPIYTKKPIISHSHPTTIKTPVGFKTEIIPGNINLHKNGTNSSNIEGRSNFEFEPLFESTYGKNDSVNGKPKNMDVNFFDQFEDHWEDPLAQESVVPNSQLSGPSITVVRPPTDFKFPNSPPPHPQYVDQKAVNFWPTKLNSYYGGGNHHSRPAYPYQHFQHYTGHGHHTGGLQGPSGESYGETHEADSVENSGSDSSKGTLMERVSLFYSDYKLLAWGIILAIGGIIALTAILGMYLNNPPTEVVTARKELGKLANFLTDPGLMKFMDRIHLEKSVMDSQLESEVIKRKKRNKKLTNS